MSQSHTQGMPNESKPLTFLGSLWPVVVALVTIAVAWGAYGTRLANQEIRSSALEASVAKYSDDLTNVRISQSRIEGNQTQMQTDISFIKNRVR